MRFRAAVLRCALAVSAIASSACARDLYVDNVQGDDDRDGRQSQSIAGLGGPVRSIARALELAQAGDRIVLAGSAEPYRESITLQGGRHGGNGRRPLVIEGGGAVLDGSQPVDKQAWEHVRGDVFRFRPPRSAYAQLFLEGRPAVRRRLETTDGRLPELEPRQWVLHQGLIYFRVEPDTLPADYDLTYAALPVGITLYEVHDVVINDLTVQGYQLDGIAAPDGARDCLLTALTCRGNGRAGITVGGASSVEIVSCLVGDNGTAQLLVEGLATVSIETSELLPRTAPPIARRGGRLFVDGEKIDR